MKQNRINAFTLIEVVLAMMLAAIVIGMAYTAFTLFTRLYGTYRTKNLAHADVRAFQQVLERDMEQAAVVSLEDDQLFFGNGDGTVDPSYVFHKDYILRIKNALPDTFKLKSVAMRTAFEGHGVRLGIVDQVLIGFEHEKEPMLIAVNKRYSAEELFNSKRTLWNR